MQRTNDIDNLDILRNKYDTGIESTASKINELREKNRAFATMNIVDFILHNRELIKLNRFLADLYVKKFNIDGDIELLYTAKSLHEKSNNITISLFNKVPLFAECAIDEINSHIEYCEKNTRQAREYHTALRDYLARNQPTSSSFFNNKKRAFRHSQDKSIEEKEQLTCKQ